MFFNDGQSQNNTINKAMSILITREIIKVIMALTATILRIWIAICSFYRTLPSAIWLGPYDFSLSSTYCCSYASLKP